MSFPAQVAQNQNFCLSESEVFDLYASLASVDITNDPEVMREIFLTLLPYCHYPTAERLKAALEEVQAASHSKLLDTFHKTGPRGFRALVQTLASSSAQGC